MEAGAVEVGAGDALIVTDVQKDFLYLATWSRRGLPIFLSRCGHPANHCSFRERGPWPRHRVAGTEGAYLVRVAPALRALAEAVDAETR